MSMAHPTRRDFPRTVGARRRVRNLQIVIDYSILFIAA